MPNVMRAAAVLSLVALPLAAGAQTAPLAPEKQIAAAVAPLPKEMREGATVLGYGADGKLTSLRAGTGDMICLADDPAVERFHVACYHKGLEPFMARGRELRAAGKKTTAEVDTVRFAEIKAGKLKIPTGASSLYSLTGEPTSYDAATGEIKGASPLHVVYIPFATAETTGLSAVPTRTSAWIMFPGTPKAHIMFTPSM